MKMETNLSHAMAHSRQGNRFNHEVFAWTDESGRAESKRLSNFSSWKEFNYVVNEDEYGEGSVLTVSVENKKRVHRRLKLFFLLDWKTDGSGRLGFVSPDNKLVYQYSTTKVSLIDYHVSNRNGLIRKSLYPLTDKGIYHWKKTLKTGSLLYQPLMKGPALTVVSFDLLFAPLQKIQGKVIGIEADSKEDLRNFHKHMKTD